MSADISVVVVACVIGYCRAMAELNSDVLLAPDIYVNASVALGSAPEQVIRRVLGNVGKKHKTTSWVLAEVERLFLAIPSFKKEAVKPQMDLIRGLVEIVAVEAANDWSGALVLSAKKLGCNRVVTDHPDFADVAESQGIQFLSSDAWLLEQQTPPPPPPMSAKK